MEFDCTKEGKNIYFACREKAAKYNDLLNSRERAAELLGISTSTLANHELGVTKNVPPDTVVMMSDLPYGTSGCWLLRMQRAHFILSWWEVRLQ